MGKEALDSIGIIFGLAKVEYIYNVSFGFWLGNYFITIFEIIVIFEVWEYINYLFMYSHVDEFIRYGFR